ncbi:serine hydrolase domain-containing protein [Auraticoccus monumenti]|uniref:CubicO group peptidase, beta-lactamase class C family n=1 Tax=Auraticoccus monumenti TaxID=675864 RepID=A0A1G7BK58_9ACTN|nr:serine hydrolase domain-containing protein [Auraticoccus monumenti]SDE27439.1 CubicO group peptidase, beta-lactamase class C family [Auraticoccus monumenti]
MPLVAAAVGLLVGLVVGPHTPRATATSGDEALAADTVAALGDPRGFGAVTAVRVRDGQVSVAGVGEERMGPGPDARYELGSITKVLTGMLLADAVERGEAGLDDPLQRWLPELAGSAVGEVTLQEVATHHGGAPGLPPALIGTGLVAGVTNSNVYEISTAEVLTQARTVQLAGRGRYQYSNLGTALLGHALARATGAQDWPTLLRTRMLDPLGMTSTRIAVSGPDPDVHPHLANGWPAARWWGEGMAPAGTSTTTTAADLGRFAQAVLEGRAPGMAALEPVADDSAGGRTGLLWDVDEVDGRVLTGKNGGTAGSRTRIELDRERGEAVVLLNNTDRWVDQATRALLLGRPNPEDGPRVELPALAAPLLGLALLVGSVVGLVRVRSRTGLLDGVLQGAAGLLVLLAAGPWAHLPGQLWTGLLAGWAAVAVLSVLRRAGLPWGGSRRIVEVVSLLASVGLLLLAVAML